MFRSLVGVSGKSDNEIGVWSKGRSSAGMARINSLSFALKSLQRRLGHLNATPNSTALP